MKKNEDDIELSECVVEDKNNKKIQKKDHKNKNPKNMKKKQRMKSVWMKNQELTTQQTINYNP